MCVCERLYVCLRVSPEHFKPGPNQPPIALLHKLSLSFSLSLYLIPILPPSIPPTQTQTSHLFFLSIPILSLYPSPFLLLSLPTPPTPSVPPSTCLPPSSLLGPAGSTGSDVGSVESFRPDVGGSVRAGKAVPRSASQGRASDKAAGACYDATEILKLMGSELCFSLCVCVCLSVSTCVCVHRMYLCHRALQWCEHIRMETDIITFVQ